MKLAQHIRYKREHKYHKLRKFLVSDTVFMKIKNIYKSRRIDPITIVQVLSTHKILSYSVHENKEHFTNLDASIHLQ